MNIQLDSYPSGNDRGRHFVWLAILIVITAVCADLWERKRVDNLRSLSLEEQETVFAAIDRTAVQYRLSKERIKRLRSRVSDGSFPTFVDLGLGQTPLLKTESQIILFSPKFFEADPVSQEHSILHLASADVAGR